MAGYRWFRLDAQLLSNPKLEQLREPADVLLFVSMVAHCTRELTDGYVSDRALRGCAIDARASARGAPDRARRLHAAGLIEPTTDGWYVTGYADHNPQALRANVERGREHLRRRQAAWRAARNGVTNADDTTRHDSNNTHTQHWSPTEPPSNGVTPPITDQLGWSPFRED
jgi:hypothetical protein